MRLTTGFACCTLFLAGLACDKQVTDPGDPNPPVDETPATFLANFAKAYSQRDSTGYAAYLDSSYLFELLPNEVDPDMPNPWWDRTEELIIAGRMFKGRYGEGNVKVNSISLALTLKTVVEDHTQYQGKPEGEIWYKVTADVDLRVIAEDQGATDGSGITHFIVNSSQIFVIRRNPSDPGRYLVYKQTDQEPMSGGKQASIGTQDASWSGVKKPLPLTRFSRRAVRGAYRSAPPRRS
jgi:hypothetical protein